MPSCLSNTLLLPLHMASRCGISGSLVDVSPTSICGPSSMAIPTLATPKPRPARGTKRKPARTALEIRRPAKRARGATPKDSATGRQKVLQDAQTRPEERTELETRNNFVQPPSLATGEAVTERPTDEITQEDIIKLLPGSQHGHAADIFERGFWSTDLERDLRLHQWTASDEEALLRSCPIVSAGELYIWRAMPRLFGCELPDLFRYGLGISFYPEVAPAIASRGTGPTAPGGVFSDVAAALFPDTTMDDGHEPAVEEYFKALARILPHPIWRGDPSRLRYVLQHAVRARVGPTHAEPLVPPYSKTANNFPEFAWTCSRPAPDTSRSCAREERDRELAAAMRWMANMYILADTELSDVVDNLLDMYSHNKAGHGPGTSDSNNKSKSKSKSKSKQPKVDDVRGVDARNVLFDLELCDLQAVYQALERTPRTIDRDPNTHEVVATQLYAAPARFFIDDLKTAPDITNGHSREVLARWVRDQKRAWILSRRREALIRQRMQARSGRCKSDSAHDRPYLLDIPPFDPDGKYQTWPAVTEGQLAAIQGLVTRTMHGSAVGEARRSSP
ncbi:hypothetical protein PpBr36_08391 [Pyricularia pennisetigena]|uniref:hypothetical protein n=1 Tax=Pyricularia pennisetigena TaxID=1578925 RepID=UPI001154D2CA|nr:hypothetical protein PpBr36_08391 [Pyricularia pennisetigena]TLS24026.1 hypothetical protein PpBr36_08391 [Pyricularia pennisetigena]